MRLAGRSKADVSKFESRLHYQRRHRGDHVRRARSLAGIAIAAILVGGLIGVATFVLLPRSSSTGCAAGVGLSVVGELQGSDQQAESASAGQVIEYTAQISLESRCPIRDATITIRLPDGTDAAIAEGVSLETGETATFAAAARYTVDPADIDRFEGSTAGGNPEEASVRASVTVTATAHRADGSADEVSAGTTYTTRIAEPADSG